VSRRALLGIAEVEIVADHRRLGRAIEGIGHQHHITLARKPAPQVAEGGPQAHNVGPYQDAGQLPWPVGWYRTASQLPSAVFTVTSFSATLAPILFCAKAGALATPALATVINPKLRRESLESVTRPGE
jgi:hypothetical protein